MGEPTNQESLETSSTLLALLADLCGHDVHVQTRSNKYEGKFIAADPKTASCAIEATKKDGHLCKKKLLINHDNLVYISAETVCLDILKEEMPNLLLDKNSPFKAALSRFISPPSSEPETVVAGTTQSMAGQNVPPELKKDGVSELPIDENDARVGTSATQSTAGQDVSPKPKTGGVSELQINKTDARVGTSGTQSTAGWDVSRAPKKIAVSDLRTEKNDSNFVTNAKQMTAGQEAYIQPGFLLHFHNKEGWQHVWESLYHHDGYQLHLIPRVPHQPILCPIEGPRYYYNGVDWLCLDGPLFYHHGPRIYMIPYVDGVQKVCYFCCGNENHPPLQGIWSRDGFYDYWAFVCAR